jgi:hypothetical protein
MTNFEWRTEEEQWPEQVAGNGQVVDVSLLPDYTVAEVATIYSYETRPRAYSEVAFLASLNMGLPLMEMAQSLGTNTYREWLRRFIPPVWASQAVEEEWQRFVERRSPMGLTG